MMARSIRAFRRLLGRRRGAASDFLARAHALASTGQYEAAIDAIETGLSMQPDHTLAHETLIQLLAHVQRYEQALHACARALELNPDSPGVLASLRAILPSLRHADHPDEIVQSLDRCLAVRPDHFDALLLLVQLLSKSQRFRDAIRACDRALKADPEFFPAAEIIESIVRDPASQHELVGMQLTEKSQISDEYSRLVARNVADFLTQVMTTFYTKLGVDPEIAPLVQGLNRFRLTLTAEGEHLEVQSMPILVPFERAWAQYKAGKLHEALHSFEAIFRDDSARKRAAHNPYVKEAVVRSGEILGRHYDNRGDLDPAISVYREIMELDHNSVIAGRLVLLMSRSGNLRAAAELAERTIASRPNLYPRLPQNSYIASLKGEISLK
jgi:tetratricopeptide (TPR) repeat protein